jgi:hypothetical protein
MAERPASGEGERLLTGIRTFNRQDDRERMIKTGENLFLFFFFTLKEELILFQQQTPRTDYLLS